MPDAKLHRSSTTCNSLSYAFFSLPYSSSVADPGFESREGGGGGGGGILRPQNLWSRSDHGEGLPSPPLRGPGHAPREISKIAICADMHFSPFGGIISEKSESEFAR